MSAISMASHDRGVPQLSRCRLTLGCGLLVTCEPFQVTFVTRACMQGAGRGSPSPLGRCIDTHKGLGRCIDTHRDRGLSVIMAASWVLTSLYGAPWGPQMSTLCRPLPALGGACSLSSLCCVCADALARPMQYAMRLLALSPSLPPKRPVSCVMCLAWRLMCWQARADADI